MKKTLLLLAALLSLSACGRHVVLDPETAAAANDRAWTIRSEPRPVTVTTVNTAAQQ